MEKSTHKGRAACCSLITLQNTLLGWSVETYDLIGARTKTVKDLFLKKAQS